MSAAAALRSLDAAASHKLDAARRQASGVFASAGYELVEPSVIAPADVFLDRLGERVRRQTCFFEDGTGQELCLRPEITIPVCQMALEGGYDGARPLRLRYAGSVFRLAADGAGALEQSAQAGAELLGFNKIASGDAEIATLALQAVEACGVSDWRMILGDTGAFTDLVTGLSLSDRQRARLKARFEAHGSGLVAHLPATEPPMIMRALDLDLARAEVASALEARGLTLTGARTIDDVARRLADRAGRAEADSVPHAARGALERFFALNAPLANAAALLTQFFDGMNMASDAPARLAALATALERAGAPLDRIVFDAGVHAPLGYYTGLEFRIDAGGRAIAGGGRYDALVGELAGKPDWRVPAIGCALFLDAIAGSRP